MNPRGVPRFAGPLVVLALVWALGGAVILALGPDAGPWGTARAAEHANPCNPCNPQETAGSTPGNPCNPCNPRNPCNPDAATSSNPCNPCNPDTATSSNPCNPCNIEEVTESTPANPCNPCNPCNPQAVTEGATANPCNPCQPPSAESMGSEKMETGAKMGEGKEASMGGAMSGRESAGMDEEERAREEAARMLRDWSESYHGWEIVSGYVLSPSHGDRLVQTYVDSEETAAVYRHNATQRVERRTDFRRYPEGATILQRSWRRKASGGPGEAGPVFFMRKEAPGYDPEGGDWRYGLGSPDFRLIGQGMSKEMAFCKECHAQVAERDFLYSVDR